MIVFDVDGTLIAGEPVDWRSFEDSFENVAGFSLTPEFFASLEEVTATAIVQQALRQWELGKRLEAQTAIRSGYVSRLRAAHAQDPKSFPARPGVVALFQDLRARGIRIAIATGDWRESITFKLAAAGIDITGIPLVTSSEHASRADIIAAAVLAAGGTLAEAMYVGDGVWDLRACRQLGIPFLGTGSRHERLRAAGALHLLEDLAPEGFHQARAALWETAHGFTLAQESLIKDSAS